jgi:hypothetical protein
MKVFSTSYGEVPEMLSRFVPFEFNGCLKTMAIMSLYTLFGDLAFLNSGGLLVFVGTEPHSFSLSLMRLGGKIVVGNTLFSVIMRILSSDVFSFVCFSFSCCFLFSFVLLSNLSYMCLYAYDKTLQAHRKSHFSSSYSYVMGVECCDVISGKISLIYITFSVVWMLIEWSVKWGRAAKDACFAFSLLTFRSISAVEKFPLLSGLETPVNSVVPWLNLGKFRARC